MAAQMELFIGNDNTLELLGLENAALSTYVNTATVTATVTDEFSGLELSGQVWPLTLEYVAGSDGDYRGVLSDSLVVVENQRLIGVVTADGGAGLRGRWTDSIICKVRT